MSYWHSREHARLVLGSMVLQPTMRVDLDHPALRTFTLPIR